MRRRGILITLPALSKNASGPPQESLEEAITPNKDTGT
jgi:hypothetical protein